MSNVSLPRLATAAPRLAVGPLALAGFFLPWAHGPGVLAASRFSGFTLVGFAGRLHALQLPLSQNAALLAGRGAIVGIAVAATWQIVLAGGRPRHPAYALSGWYIAAAAAFCLAAGALRSGISVPPPGLALLALAGMVFIGCELARSSSHRHPRGARTLDEHRSPDSLETP